MTVEKQGGYQCPCILNLNLTIINEKTVVKANRIG